MLQHFCWRRFLLLLTLCSAFALRLIDLTKQNIWWDEARNIDVALRPFWQIAIAPELDIQPPIYYWLLHGWLRITGIHIGDDPVHIAFFARFLSVFAGVIGVTLIFRLAQSCFAPTPHTKQALTPIPHSAFRILHSASLLSTLIAAASPFWLAESQETRMYTVGMMFLLAAATMKIRDWRLEIGDWENDTNRVTLQSPISTLLFPLFSALALLTHYNALFILVAWYGWWGIWSLLQPDRWQQLRRLLVSGLLLTLFVAPILPIALRQIPGYENPNLVVPTISDYLRQNWVAYLGGYAFDSAQLNGYSVWWLWAALVLSSAGIILTFAREKTISETQYATRNTQYIIFLLVWLLGGLALYYIAVMDRGAFNVRYSSFVTPALYLLLGFGAAAWGQFWKPFGWIATIILLCGLPSTIQADLYDTRFFREDTAGVANWLRANTYAGDLILVDQKYPFGFYYQRFAIDTEANPIGGEAVDARYLFVDVNTIDQRLNQWAANAQRIFWLQWFESDTDPRHAVRFLLDKEGQHVGSQTFQGYQVSWWQMTPPTHFALLPNVAPLHVRFAAAVETVVVSLPQKLDNTSFAEMHGIPVVIRWRRVAGGSVDRPLKVRVALYNQAGNRIAQADERLLNDRHLPPSSWSENDQPLNLYFLEIPENLSDDEYKLSLLVYDAETLEALPFLDKAGNEASIEFFFNQSLQ